MWTPDKMKEVLEKNDDQVCKAVVKLYEKQTEDEKVSQDTKHSNGVGFNGTDAPILSSFAQQYMQRGFLTDKQVALARKKIMKYAKQLCKIANDAIATQYIAEKNEEFKQMIPEEYRSKVVMPKVEYLGNGVICSTVTI